MRLPVRPYLLAGLALAGALAPVGARLMDVEYRSVQEMDPKKGACTDTTTEEPCLYMREAPELTSKVVAKLWRYEPVETVAFRGDWVKVRDYDGFEGWVPVDRLVDTPTVCVSFTEGKIRQKPSTSSKVVWILDRGYPLRVFGARDDWYEVSDLADVSGWIHASAVWGFPPPSSGQGRTIP